MERKISEESLNYLEARIPELAGLKLVEARHAARSSGSTLVEAHNSNLVRISPGGGVEVIRALPKRIPVERGTVIRRRR